MLKILKIAYRNLMRYARRTLLTATLVVIGMVAVLVFIAVAGSFKEYMIGQITDSMLGHLQVHRTGYVKSIDNSPLDLNMTDEEYAKITEILKKDEGIESYSHRLKFSGMISNYKETTNVRLNAVNPEQELKTLPLLKQRVSKKSETADSPEMKQGEFWIPESLAEGLDVKIGDQLVLIATNKDGSVNGLPLIVSGVVGVMTGPGGRDGYMHIDDAYQLLRINKGEVNEIAIKLKTFENTTTSTKYLQKALSTLTDEEGKAVFELHTWDKLSPFSSIANIIDLLTFFVKFILIAIVLVSIMNVMLMAVYERIREIGTIAAIGTSPAKIRALFLTEGLLLGIFGSMCGSLISLGIIKLLNVTQITFAFGKQDALLLQPHISLQEVLTTSVIVILIAALASLQPAIKASKLEPIEALRHV